VEVALAPYIRTRQEALRIRQKLTAHLISHISFSNNEEPVHNLNLACPTPATVVRDVSSSAPLPGLRGRYLDALRRHTEAVEKRRILQDELNELRMEHAEDDSREAQEKALREFAQSYAELERQRRLHARLSVILSTLEKLADAAPKLVRGELKAVLDDDDGASQSPDPPTASLELGGQDPQTEKLMYRLKREVLLARRAADLAKNYKSTGNASKRSLADEVAALRRARDALVAWVEGELGKISEDSSILSDEHRSPQKSLPSPTESQQPGEETEISTDAKRDEINRLYEVYLQQRRSFVQTIAAVTSKTWTNDPISASSLVRRQNSTTDNIDLATFPEPLWHPALTTLTVVPTLQSLSDVVLTLQQHHAHLRRALTSSTSETANTLRRLADESHLVPPQTDSMHVWAAAAEEAMTELEEQVGTWYSKAEENIKSAKQVVESAEERGKVFERLKGKI
jgi:hypothetical protein